MTPDNFKAIGKMVFGERWKEEAAKACQMSVRSIHRYANGERPLPENVAKLMVVLLLRQYADIGKLIKKIS